MLTELICTRHRALSSGRIEVLPDLFLWGMVTENRHILFRQVVGHTLRVVVSPTE